MTAVKRLVFIILFLFACLLAGELFLVLGIKPGALHLLQTGHCATTPPLFSLFNSVLMCIHMWLCECEARVLDTLGLQLQACVLGPQLGYS